MRKNQHLTRRKREASQIHLSVCEALLSSPHLRTRKYPFPIAFPCRPAGQRVTYGDTSGGEGREDFISDREERNVTLQ